MTSATTVLFKPLQSLRSHSSLPANSIPPAVALLSKKVSESPFLYLPSKPINLILSSQPKHKISHPILVPLAAQTSDWDQQEEEVEEGSVDDEDSSFPDPPEEAKIFVGNLPYDFDSEKLAELFNQAGVVEIAEVIYNRDTDQSRGFGFVTMSTVEEADNAVGMFNRYELNGRLLTVNKAAPRGSQPERAPKVYGSSFRVYVSNLPWQIDSVRLREVFSEHGKVVDAKVIFDRETGRSRGFGFVSMATETDLKDAIAALDGQSLDGRVIRVNVAEERLRASSF